MRWIITLMLILFCGYANSCPDGLSDGVICKNAKKSHLSPSIGEDSPPQITYLYKPECVWCKLAKPLIEEWRKSLPENVRYEELDAFGTSEGRQVGNMVGFERVPVLVVNRKYLITTKSQYERSDNEFEDEFQRALKDASNIMTNAIGWNSVGIDKIRFDCDTNKSNRKDPIESTKDNIERYKDPKNFLGAQYMVPRSCFT